MIPTSSCNLDIIKCFYELYRHYNTFVSKKNRPPKVHDSQASILSLDYEWIMWKGGLYSIPSLQHESSIL